MAHVDYSYLILFLYTLGLVGVLAVFFSLTPRGGDLPLVIIATITIMSAFVSVRNLPLAAIACVAPVARHIALLEAEQATTGVCGTTSLFLRQNKVAGRCRRSHDRSGRGRRPLSKQLATDDPYPSGAVAFMKQHRLSGNLLSTYDWGNYPDLACVAVVEAVYRRPWRNRLFAQGDRGLPRVPFRSSGCRMRCCAVTRMTSY